MVSCWEEQSNILKKKKKKKEAGKLEPNNLTTTFASFDVANDVVNRATRSHDKSTCFEDPVWLQAPDITLRLVPTLDNVLTPSYRRTQYCRRF